MQLRKLIRLLTETQEKVGPYAHVTIDVEKYKNWHGAWDLDRVESVSTTMVEALDPKTDHEYEHGQSLPTVVLNDVQV